MTHPQPQPTDHTQPAATTPNTPGVEHLARRPRVGPVIDIVGSLVLMVLIPQMLVRAFAVIAVVLLGARPDTTAYVVADIVGVIIGLAIGFGLAVRRLTRVLEGRTAELATTSAVRCQS